MLSYEIVTALQNKNSYFCINMVAIIHSEGWAVSNDAKQDIASHLSDDRTRMEQQPYITVRNIFNGLGVLKEGINVGVLIHGKELSGIVKKIGIEITTINITGETTGIKDKLKQIII